MNRLSSLFTHGVFARLLREDDSSAHETGASGGSLDAQVDRFLGEYEAAAKKDDLPDDLPVDQMEALDWRDLVKGRIIEAGESNKDNDGPEDAAPGADAMAGDDEGGLGIDKLNVEAFANDVVRLIENYDSLLEVRSTIIRRAREFLTKSYDDEVVEAFEDTLRDDHGMEAGVSKEELRADRAPAPAADRANGSAAPGGGSVA